MRLICLFIFLCLTFPAQAQETLVTEPTRIEVDSEAGEIHFYIEGELSTVLKNDGLHVRDHIHFGGTIIDSGKDFYFREKDSEKGNKNAP